MIASFMPPSELWRLRSLCRTFHPIALLHITSKASSASDVRSIAELFNSLIPSASPAFIGRLLKPKNFDGRALARFFALLSCINKSPSACGKLLRELGLSLEGLLAVLDQWDFDLKGVGKTVLELGLGIDEKLEVLAFLSLEKGLQGDSLVQAVIDSSDEPFSNEHLVRLFHLSEPYFDDVLRVVEVLLTSGRKNVSDVAELIRGLHFGPNETVMMLKNLPLDWSESGRVLRALTLPAASLASTLVGLRLGNDMVALSKVFKELELDRRGMIDVLRRMQLRHIRDYGCLARELGLSRDTHTVAGIINHIEAPGPYALASLLRQLSLNTKEMATLLGHIDLAREYDEADDSPALARILIGLGLSMADLADVLGHLFASGHLTKIGLKVTVGALWKQTTLSVLELIDLLDEFPLMGILSRDEVVGVLEDLVPFRNPDELCLLRWAPCLMMTSARTQVAV
ncbi:hypothetical protein HK102_002891 [Quaeritorhiza haematococci]|nr:hypothetical protein HK102_002891 [Quaeritorhiza haematococci]